MFEASEHSPMNIVFYNVFTKLNCFEKAMVTCSHYRHRPKSITFPVDRRTSSAYLSRQIAACQQQSVYFHLTEFSLTGNGYNMLTRVLLVHLSMIVACFR